jgi:hypothetical protein
MLNNIQNTVDQHEGPGELPQLAAKGPNLTADHIKANLGIKRDIGKDIEWATEAYNTTVCRVFGTAMRGSLPRELRDMVYGHLTRGHVALSLTGGTSNRISVGSVQTPHDIGPYFWAAPDHTTTPSVPSISGAMVLSTLTSPESSWRVGIEQAPLRSSL